MKKFCFLIALLALAACNSNNGYIVKGTLTGVDSITTNGKVYLSNFDRNDPIKDTVDLTNGSFVFKGYVSSPERYAISFDGIQGRIYIFLENEKYKVSADASDLSAAKVEGGSTQSLMNIVSDKRAALESNLGDANDLIKEYRDPNTSSERKNEIVAMFDEIDEKVNAFNDSLVKANPLSNFSLMALKDDLDNLSLSDAEAMLEEYKAKVEFAGNKMVSNIENEINSLKPLQNGCIAPEFTMKNPDGKEIALSEIYKKNKITMIDFWAGWCNPCRQFNPKLVNIYAKYHKKGFEVLGVSMDRDRNTWTKAIKDDKLTWPQVSDVNFWDCEPVRLYAVHYIPQNAFVDQEGKILGRKLSEEEIVALLEEYLK